MSDPKSSRHGSKPVPQYLGQGLREFDEIVKGRLCQPAPDALGALLMLILGNTNIRPLHQ
jgi:hypothetical protein